MMKKEIQTHKVFPSKKLSKPGKGHLDESTELAADLIDIIDDRELASLAGLTVDQIEKIRDEHIK